MSDLELHPSLAKPFFAYARARHAVYLSREVQKKEWPWTADAILQQYRFCNVFRELDKTTRWFREHIRDPLRDDDLVLFATVAFRWFNRVETFKTLLQAWEGAGARELFEGWVYDGATTEVRHILRNDAKPPYTTGAYMIKTPAGMDKIDGLMWCVENVNQSLGPLLEAFRNVETLTMEGAWALLTQFPYLGDFMAYEVVTDLRHTKFLADAPDVMTWANPGPGAARGMARVLGLPLDRFNRAKDADRVEIIRNMRLLVELANGNTALWPSPWPRWELREVEHTLCEFDKYERARLGEGRPKQLFRRPT